jgi:hypothetical protein
MGIKIHLCEIRISDAHGQQKEVVKNPGRLCDGSILNCSTNPPGAVGTGQSWTAASPPGGYWFEKIAAEPSGDDVVLEFVDEDGNPVDFSAFLIWEPTGDVGDVAVKNGKLKLPKKRLVEQADQWRDKLKRADQPTLTENPLFVISPISLKAEFLPYTVVVIVHK